MSDSELPIKVVSPMYKIYEKYISRDYKQAGIISASTMILFTSLSLVIPDSFYPGGTFSPNIYIAINIIALIYLFFQRQGDYDEYFVNNVKLFITILCFSLSTLIIQKTSFAIFMIEALLFIIFYSLITISLNLSTGLSGVLNFGVVAQVAIGAVILSLFSVRGTPIILAFTYAIIGGAIFSGLLAMTTLRLRDDYFAIVSITLGEIIRQILLTEPSLRARKGSDDLTTAAIIDIPQPFFDVFASNIQPLIPTLTYRLFLGIFGMVILLIILFIVNLIFYSPYGRILKSIREDETVTNVYGKNIFYYKIVIMMFSGAIAAVGGSFLAWFSIVITPENFMPLVTFFAWTAFIMGGRGNNKGMIVGSMLFILLQRSSRFLNNKESGTYQFLNNVVHFFNSDAPNLSFGNLQLIIVGVTLIAFLRFWPRGILSEEAYRPKINGIKLPPPGSQVSKTEENEKIGEEE